MFETFRQRSKHNSSGSSSIAVLHNENESNLDGCFFDGDSRSSSISLTSVSSQQDGNSANLSSDDLSANQNPSFVINQDSNSSIEILQEPHNVQGISPLPKR